jgi:hypothetical protein
LALKMLLPPLSTMSSEQPKSKVRVEFMQAR